LQSSNLVLRLVLGRRMMRRKILKVMRMRRMMRRKRRRMRMRSMWMFGRIPELLRDSCNSSIRLTGNTGLMVT
jgi:hypothetical protein